jgi:hypothetical protein
MTEPDEQSDWVNGVRARGLDDAVNLMLDILEPMGPLGAQILWFTQPVTRLFGWHKAVGIVAQALEEPEGILRLRQRLENDTTP